MTVRLYKAEDFLDPLLTVFQYHADIIKDDYIMLQTIKLQVITKSLSLGIPMLKIPLNYDKDWILISL